MRYIFLAITLILTVSLAIAQPDQCAAILQDALAETNENCDGLEPDSICFGSGSVKVSDGSDASSTLGASANKMSIGGVGQIVTSPIDLETGGVGVAVMSLSVNSPDSNVQETIALVLVGDATLEILSPPENSRANPDLPAFLLRGSSTTSDCSDSANGLIVQTPHDMQLTLNINGADVTMSSTVYFTVADERSLSVATLEGQAVVGPVEGERTTLVTGFTAEIDLDPDTDQISGEWSDAGLFDDLDVDQLEAFETLDASFLSYEIDIPDEEYFDEIEAIMESDDFDYDDFVDQFDDFEDYEDDDYEYDDDEYDQDDVEQDEEYSEDDYEY